MYHTLFLRYLITHIDVATFYPVSSGESSIRVGRKATHTPCTLACGQESANYFSNQCRFSNYRFNGDRVLLIDNYDPIYSGKHKKIFIRTNIHSHENSKYMKLKVCFHKILNVKSLKIIYFCINYTDDINEKFSNTSPCEKLEKCCDPNRVSFTTEVTRKYFEPMKPETVELNAEPLIGIPAQTRASQTCGHPIQIVQYDSSMKLMTVILLHHMLNILNQLKQGLFQSWFLDQNRTRKITAVKCI